MKFIDTLNIRNRKWNRLFKDFYYAWLVIEENKLNISIGSNLRTVLEEIVRQNISDKNRMTYRESVNFLEKNGTLSPAITAEMQNAWTTLSDSAHTNKDKFIFEKMWKPVIKSVLMYEANSAMVNTDIENPFTDEYKKQYTHLLHQDIPEPKIKEVIKEVPIEIIKEIPKYIEVIKEVPVEKIIEVIKEVPIEVIKEIPVEKIIEVIKEVPVEKIIEVSNGIQNPIEKINVMSERDKSILLSYVPKKARTRNFYNTVDYRYEENTLFLGDKLKKDLTYNLQWGHLGLGYRKVSGTKIANYAKDYIFGSLFEAYLAKVGIVEKPVELKFIDAGNHYEDVAVKYAYNQYKDSNVVCDETGEVHKYKYLEDGFGTTNGKKDVFFDYFKNINKFISGRPDAIIMVDHNLYNPVNILVEAKTTNYKRKGTLMSYGPSLSHILQAEMYAYFFGIKKYVISYLLLKEEDYELRTTEFDSDRYMLFEYEVNVERIEEVISKIKYYDKLWKAGDNLPQYNDNDHHLELFLEAKDMSDHNNYLLHKMHVLKGGQ